MPNQAVADDEHVVSLAEGHVAVRRLESIRAGARMHGFPLQNIFRRDGVELRFDDRIAALIAVYILSGIDGRPDPENTLIRILQRGLRGKGRDDGERGGGEPEGGSVE